jgi:glycosyltransferase involved in cell wall biosynthesis
VDHSPILGGAERSVLELARAQLALGHDVSVAVGRRGPFTDALTANDIRWQELGWSERYVLTSSIASPRALLAGLPDLAKAAAALRSEVRRWRPDVVQAHTRKSQLVATLALADGQIPLIWHLRDALPRRPALRTVVMRALSRADHAVALSSWLAESYAQQDALPRSGRIGLVPSGVDSERLTGLSTAWLNGEQSPVIGFIGQIAHWKGPHLLVEAAEYLTDPSITWRIIGGVWFPSEVAYGRWLRKRLANTRAAERIDWRPTAHGPEQAFAQIDVLAHTSISPEPFGRVLVEAMFARRPIVAMGMGSAAELLDEETAVFAERADGVAFAKAVRYLVADRERARRLVDRAAQRAARYSPAAVAALMDDEYAGFMR